MRRGLTPRQNSDLEAENLRRLELDPASQETVPPHTHDFPDPTSPQFPAAVTESLAAIERRMARLAPAQMLWGLVPGDGGMFLAPAGQTTINLEEGRVVSNAGEVNITIPSNISQFAQSVLIIADTYVFITLEPGYGTFFTQGAPIRGSARDLNKITFQTDVPFAFILAFGSAIDAAEVDAVSLVQARSSTMNLAKTNGGGTPDDLTPVPLVPVTRRPNGPAQLDQASFGVDYVRAAGWGSKVYMIRNVGAADAEVELFGTDSVTLAEATRWISDPDTQPSGGGRTTIAAGEDAVLETGVPWDALQLGAAVAAAGAPAATTQLRVGMRALAPGVR